VSTARGARSGRAGRVRDGGLPRERAIGDPGKGKRAAGVARLVRRCQMGRHDQ
jgi:hypothetical protein